MNILNIIQCTELGGMEQTTLLTLEGLQERGHSISLISLNPIGALGPRLKAADIPHQGLNYRGFLGWRSYPDMRRAFGSLPADAILMTGHNLFAMLAIARNPAPRKILAVHYHHLEDNRGHSRWRLFYGLARRVFDHITFASEAIRQEAIGIYPGIENMSLAVPNPFVLQPVATKQERQLARNRLGIAPQTRVVGNAGWLIQRKRWDVFLRVAAAILATRPDTLFLIAGDGPDREALQAMTNDLGISDSVRFLGWLPDLGDFYRSLDVLLFNSDFDALGRTPAEAAAHGVPVVASVVFGGLKELFRSDEEAVVLDTHDYPKLSAAVMALLDDRDRHAQLARAGYERVAEYGSVAVRAEIFEKLMSNGRPHPQRDRGTAT